MDRDVLLEALSALTGTTVKPLTDLKPGDTAEVLTLENYLATVFNNLAEITEDSGHWPSFRRLFKQTLNLNPQKSRDKKDVKVSTRTSEQKTLSLSDKQQEKKSETSILRSEMFVDMDKFLDPGYDFDFRNFMDDSECSRGGEPYKRPCGYYRFALKVEDKYPDGNAWLGFGCWRTNSEPGEWPVSFHGTSIEGAKGIVNSNYKAGSGNVHGRGIYSTPDITIAEGYTMFKSFTSKKTGKIYNVIMQNRINPTARIKATEDIWLIEVPEGTTAEEEKKIVERSIRPYGILVKEVQESTSAFSSSD